jgi:hypothetical protein
VGTASLGCATGVKCGSAGYHVAMIGTAIEGAKSLVELARAYDKMDLYQKAVELMAQVTELMQENFDLKTQLVELKQKLEVKQRVHYDADTHTLTMDGESNRYCAHCYDDKGKLFHMKRNEEQSMQAFYWQCRNCKFNTHWIDASTGKRRPD